MAPELTQNDLKMTPESTLQTLTQTGPEMALPDLILRPQISNGPEWVIFHVLLTIADKKHDRSKDWIRPPS